MTDKELLELAAKAAGWTWWQSKHGYWNVTNPDGESRACCVGWTKFDSHTGEELPEPTPSDALSECGWYPLTDDGDALRLAVKLRLEVDIGNGWAIAKTPSTPFATVEETSEDSYAATRRVIVRAAAEIGKVMK